MTGHKNHSKLNKKKSIFSLIFLLGIMFIFSGCISMPGRYRGPEDPGTGGMNHDRHHSGSVYYMDQISLYRGGSFAIRNNMGQIIYRVRGDLFSQGRRLTVSSRNGRVLYYITRSSSRYNSTYRVYSHGRWVAKIRKKGSRNNDRYYVNSRNGKDYTVQGNFMNRIYAFFYRGRQVAQITKRRRPYSGNYKIEIDPLQNNIVILFTSIIIDMDNMTRRR